MALLTVSALSSFAQAPGAPAGAPLAAPGAQPVQGAAGAGGSRLGVNGIAVVDVAYIFKNHVRFKQQMEEMKSRVETAEADVKKDQESIKRKAEELKTFNPGTPNYKQVENDLIKMQGDLQLKVSLQKKDFMEQEGRVYFNVSREIDDAVKQLATKNGIVMVLRFNGDPVDGNNRDEILRGINKAIVYNDPRMDITPYVLQDLNRAATGTGPVGVRPPPGAAQPTR